MVMARRIWRSRALRCRTALIVITALAASAVATAHAANPVVISQIYGGGGNAGATLRNDFVELFNRGETSVDVTGWCLQYASSTGAFTLGNNQTTALAGSIAPGGYYLIQLAQGTGGTQNLPTPDAIGTTAASATSGKLALLNQCATAFGDAEPLNSARLVDFVGFGAAASRFEGAAPTATLSNTTAALRASNGCQDTDNNTADFAVGAPNPRNSLSPTQSCGAQNSNIVLDCPTTVAAVVGTPTTQTLTARDADGIVVDAQLAPPPTAGITLAFTPSMMTGATETASLQIAGTLTAGNYPISVTFSNADAPPQSASCPITVTVSAPANIARIHEIQGAAHISPLRDQAVAQVPGIVIARVGNGFYMQDPQPDADDATSEGIFVFTSSAPTVAVGDSVRVSGTVREFRPGGSGGTENLTLTEIVSPTIVTVSTGNVLPAPLVIGAAGRIPPASVIDNDATGDVETSGVFEPATDGIDFYESLEAMRVQIDQPVAVGPTNEFGELPVVGDNGARAGPRTGRGGVVIRADDFNPERVFLDDTLAPTPKVNVGDTASVAVGVMDYSFGNFKLFVTSTPAFIDAGLAAEVTDPARADQLTIASYNVENLRPSDSPAKFATLAGQIVTNQRSPDIVGVIEIQDNSGATNDGVVAADQTFAALIAAIRAAGGPTYDHRQIDPVNGSDGGEPGGNIRVGFLFNPARVTFVDRPGGTSTSATTVIAGPTGAQLSASPGRIDPTNPAFNGSRKPLVGEFLFNGHKLFVIANHFNSKGGDQPLFGRFQPPARVTEAQRVQQAAVVADFVQALRAVQPDANVVVLGDLNDFQFSDAVTRLKAGGLVDLVETLPESERYTYVFEGNSQSLDHILVSEALATRALPQYDVVHVNSEFADQASDHEPEVVKLLLPLQEVTGQLLVLRPILVPDLQTRTFRGFVTLVNLSRSTIAGPLQVVFDNLPSNVTLLNATGTRNGDPYITVPRTTFPPGAIALVEVRIDKPLFTFVNFELHVYSAQF